MPVKARTKKEIVIEHDDDFDPPEMKGGLPDESLTVELAAKAAPIHSNGHFQRSLLPGEHPPSDYQWNIYEKVCTSEESFQVEAVAGSGKTTTGQGIANRSGLGQQMLCIAFSKKIAETFKEKMPMATSSTIHSLALSVFKGRTRYLSWTKDSIDAESKKIKHIVAELKIDKQYGEYENWEVQGMFHDIIHYMMVSLTPPIAEAINEMAEKFVVRLPGKVDDVAEHCKIILQRAREMAFGSNGGVAIINFDEMIYYPVVEQMQFQPFHTVFVDEAQDLNALQHGVLELIPKTRLIAVGDPNQAIMMFAGAENDSMGMLKNKFNLENMPLHLNYRCGKEIVRHAQKTVPHIQYPDWQREGEVKTIEQGKLHSSLSTGSFVLCRVNAPLISLCFRLIQAGIRARIRGRDTSLMFSKLIRQIMGRDTDIGNFPLLLERWKDKEIQRIFNNGGRRAPMLMGFIQDKSECLMSFYDNISPYSIKEFTDGISAIFSDDSRAAVNLMSVHASKGLEAEDVFLINPSKLPLVWPGQEESQYEQELHLDYVWRTRAMNRLIYVQGDNDE